MRIYKLAQRNFGEQDKNSPKFRMDHRGRKYDRKDVHVSATQRQDRFVFISQSIPSLLTPQ